LQQGAWVDIFGDRLGQSLKAFDLVIDVFAGAVVVTVVTGVCICLLLLAVSYRVTVGW
jgi:hypothetical protein